MDVLSVWGTGRPRREFLYVDDLTDGLVFALKNYSGALPLNIGAAKDRSIAEIATIIAKVTGFEGQIVFDTSRPDGAPAKLMDSSRIYGAGWRPQTGLEAGLAQTYEWYFQNYSLKKAA